MDGPYENRIGSVEKYLNCNISNVRFQTPYTVTIMVIKLFKQLSTITSVIKGQNWAVRQNHSTGSPTMSRPSRFPIHIS